MTVTDPRTPTGSPADPPADAATLTCVFAVRRDGAPSLTDVPGHPRGGPLGALVLPGTGLSAVVQQVPAVDFTEQALRRRLGDPLALERCARTHHAVISVAAARGAVVPLPLTTLFTSPDRAVQALAGQRARFVSALERVTGRAEWAVKVHIGRAERASGGASDAWAVAGADAPRINAGDAPGAGIGTGAAYLARVRGRERERRDRQEAVRRVAEHVHQVAAGFAVAAVRRRPHSAAITGEGLSQVLNSAFLVDDGAAAALVAAVRALSGPRAGLDVRIDVSGPWPPYSFTGDADEHGGHDPDRRAEEVR